MGFFCAYNHTEHFEEKAKAPEDFYRKLDMLILEKVADAMIAIPGWEKSKGARAEIEYAKNNNLKIFYPKSVKDLDEVINWAKQ